MLAVCLGLFLTVQGPATQSPPREVPFNLHRNYLIVVKGLIGPLDDLSFVIDTGVYRTIVDERIIRRLHLATHGSGKALTVDHVVEMPRATLFELAWGPMRATDLEIMVFDLSAVSRQVGMRVDVVLGLDLLRRRSFTIDYAARKILFGFVEPTGTRVAFDASVPYLAVRALIDGHPLRLLVDTGSDSLAVFADRLGQGREPFSTQATGHGLNGTVPFKQANVLRVFIGGTEVHDVKVFIIQGLPDFKGYDGHLGPRALQASRVHFDFERMQFEWNK